MPSPERTKTYNQTFTNYCFMKKVCINCKNVLDYLADRNILLDTRNLNPRALIYAKSSDGNISATFF